MVWEKNGALLVPGGVQMHSKLSADLIRGGKVVSKWELGSGLVTTQGVTMIAQAMANTNPSYIALLNYHDSSTGTTAAAVGDTALTTAPAATVGSRPSGTQTASAVSTNYLYQTVGTQSFTGGLAITEWGLFRLSRTAGNGPPGSDTMLDHKVFGAINVVSGDSIAYTYQLTVTAGG